MSKVALLHWAICRCTCISLSIYNGSSKPWFIRQPCGWRLAGLKTTPSTNPACWDVTIGGEVWSTWHRHVIMGRGIEAPGTLAPAIFVERHVASFVRFRKPHTRWGKKGPPKPCVSTGRNQILSRYRQASIDFLIVPFCGCIHGCIQCWWTGPSVIAACGPGTRWQDNGCMGTTPGHWQLCYNSNKKPCGMIIGTQCNKPFGGAPATEKHPQKCLVVFQRGFQNSFRAVWQGPP